MTREEAIEELKILKEEYWDDDGYGHETKQYDDTMFALDMAIKALEALEEKSCEGCRYETNAGFEEECHYCDRWGSDRYVKKEEEEE